MKRIDQTPPVTYETMEEAQSVADSLQSGELEGWTYVVATDMLKGGFRVKAYDEAGEFVGFWTCSGYAQTIYDSFRK